MAYLEKRIGSYSDIGNTRKTNEDSIIAFINNASENKVGLVAGVADGMGGYEGGEVASNFIKEEIEKLYKNNEYLNLASLLQTSDNNLGYIFKMSINEINKALYEKKQNSENLKEMGSTLTCGLGYETSLYIAHVGDSRAYQIRSGKIKQITEDHTIRERIKNNKEELFKDSPEPQYYPLLYRSMGHKPWLKIDFHTIKVEPNDLYIFCTDGCYNFVDEKTMLLTMMNLEFDPQKSCEKIVEIAKNNGSTDNISVVLVYYVEFMGLEVENKEKTARLKL